MDLRRPCTPLLALLLVSIAAEDAAGVPAHNSPFSAVVVTPAGAPRAPPLSGFGSEFIFQTTGDAQLNGLLTAGASRVARFPGGTPADYFDWRVGWMQLPTGPGCGGCDEVLWRPTPPADLAAYLAATRQHACLVVNTLTANLSYALEGLAAHKAAGTAIDLLEMSNEMYDATRADVLAVYPMPRDYAKKMSVWSAAIREAHPAAKIAWVGLANEWDNRTRSWNAEVFPLSAAADAATIHLYPGLPDLNLSAPSAYPQLLGGLFPLLEGFASYTTATIPARLELWVTEMGTWGNTQSEGTWLQALWHTAFALQLPTFLPRISLLAPYCAVCGDPQMPSFTTDAGPVVPPNTTLPPGAWRSTASGHGYSLLFSFFNSLSVANMQALSFAPNGVLDPSVPSSRQLVGARTLDSAGSDAAYLLLNLGAVAAPLDLSHASACPLPDSARCASCFSPRNVSDVARQGLRVEQLVHSAATLAPGAPLDLPAYAIAVVSCGAC